MDLETADRLVLERIHAEPNVLLKRYSSMHGLREDCPLTAEMVLRHWRTETTLARQLRQSDNTRRPKEFAQAYDQFYGELYWLNEWKLLPSRERARINYGFLAKLIGPARDVYEVGSGKGELISFLANLGYRCTATEITVERGEKWTPADTTVTWSRSDGVHLGEYEIASSHDVVLSMQVIEHVHPDDIQTHFEHVAKILRKGGRYIFSTPHRLFGPSDISTIFDLPEPMGFHLHEYTNTELVALARAAGFSRIQAIYLPPRQVRPYLPVAFASTPYLHFLLTLEIATNALPKRRRKWLFRVLRFAMLLRRDVFLIATK